MDFSSCVIGIELGSTRIKAVLVDNKGCILSSGSFSWENRYENGIWTYSYEEIKRGLSACYKNLKKDTIDRYGKTIRKVGALGISGMMHGYIPLDSSGNTLSEFRTWRNTITGEAAEKLSSAFDFNIPQRWSSAHLFQAILNKESYVADVASLCTLSTYVTYLLTGKIKVGIGDASGMFPIDSSTLDYDKAMMGKVDKMIEDLGYNLKLENILPEVLVAGETAGYLTLDGALLLDDEGELESGIPLSPPEGDAGTGMVATNSVRERTGNISAGTSDFLMLVLDKHICSHREIDMVTTPSGKPVAMVHCNNCTTDINNWINLFGEFASLMGLKVTNDELYTKLYSIALDGEKDAGGLISCNYYSGEGITDFDSGFPLFIHRPDAKMTLSSFMRSHMMSALATLKIGMDILRKENVTIEKIYGHGGYFKTPVIGQMMVSAALASPVSVMKTAGEGGPYGMAILTQYMLDSKGLALEDYLENCIFKDVETITLRADKEDVAGFGIYMGNYIKLLEIERKAVETL